MIRRSQKLGACLNVEKNRQRKSGGGKKIFRIVDSFVSIFLYILKVSLKNKVKIILIQKKKMKIKKKKKTL